MLRSKQFAKKTKRGGIVTLSREHYLRDDIGCGYEHCTQCQQDSAPLRGNVLLIPDTNVVLHQLDLLEHPTLTNAIVLSTVLEEVKHRSLQSYQRLRALIGDPNKHFFVFVNEHCRETFIEQLPGESANDRNDRAIRTTAQWYEKHLAHLASEKSTGGAAEEANDEEGGAPSIVLLTNDAASLAIAKGMGLTAHRVYDYVRLLSHHPELLDLVAQRDFEGDGAKEFAASFPPHLGAAEIQRGVKHGTYLQGVFHTSRETVREAFVTVRGRDDAILVQGAADMNRAVDGDVVAVLVLPEAEWKAPLDVVDNEGAAAPQLPEEPKESEEKEEEGKEKEDEKKEEDSATAAAVTSTKEKGDKKVQEGDGDGSEDKEKEKKKKKKRKSKGKEEGTDGVDGEDEKESGDSAKKAEKEKAKDTSAPASSAALDPARAVAKRKDPEAVGTKVPTGRIVGIVRRAWRPYCGTLEAVADEKTQHRIFVPYDRRVQRVRVQTQQGPALSGMCIIVAIDAWPESSTLPLGHFVRTLGKAGEVGTETEALLVEHDVPYEPFSHAVLSDLPKLPWTISASDYASRADFRDLNVCSIDPPGCTDIDDALHIRTLPNGNYEVGVHIADVSHFIRPNTALDDEAAKRGTTVYLSNKRIDMVPELLSSNLCSLRCHVERFAFSVLWEMTPEANIVGTRFTKSVIKSKESFMYSEAQMRIDDKTDNSSLTQGLRQLNALAKILKERRLQQGALFLASPEVRFRLDEESQDPLDVEIKQMLETNSLVEEFMLLANVSTAEHIFRAFPQCAVLRRHPTPPEVRFAALVRAAQGFGIELDTSSSKALAISLDRAESPEHPYLNTLLRIMATRCMYQAVYFCSGSFTEKEFHHYGLAAPIYTHFTSPIRRYPDIMVHRLLAASIGADRTFPEILNKERCAQLCDRMNRKGRMAQLASRASTDLHSGIFFRSKPIESEAFVVGVRKNTINVLIPKFGLEGPVTFPASDGSDAKPIFDYDPDTPTLTVKGISAQPLRFKALDEVRIRVEALSGESGQHGLRLLFIHPTPEASAAAVVPGGQSASKKARKEEKQKK